MPKHTFDPGYPPSLAKLIGEFPGSETYPLKDFRLEWGPIFHRGRLDGSARVVVIGQDPAQHEAVTRRILVGEAGHRVQGFLDKLGIDRSYAMINTFLYSVRPGADLRRLAVNSRISRYRNRWFDAVIGPNVEVVVALGGLADRAWQVWRLTAKGRASTPFQTKITHPTAPSSGSHGDRVKLARAEATLATNWNTGLDALRPHLRHPDRRVNQAHYGTVLTEQDLIAIPEADLPPGMPGWMREHGAWAARGAGAASRYTITITVPPHLR